MKKSILLFLLAMMTGISSFARDFIYTYEGQTITYTVIDEEAQTCATKAGDNFTAGNIISGDLVLPDNPKDDDTEFTLIAVGDYAFNRCSGLSSITIPNSVTSIGEGAFSSCRGLTSVTIPTSVTTVGNNAFFGCAGLKKAEFASIESLCKIQFGGTNTSNPLNYAHHLYIDGEEITEVVIPETITKLRRTFSGASHIKSVAIPNSVTNIDSYAFYNCIGLTSITIPNSVTTIGAFAFLGCTGLTSITIPNSVTSIGERAFSNCTSLKRFIVEDENPNYKVTDGVLFNRNNTELIIFPPGKNGTYAIPTSVTTIGNYAFYNCTGLTSVVIPNSVQTIGNSAFSGCSGMTSTTIPTSVTTIGNSAFFGCTSLTSVVIPNSVTSIGDEAFSGCTRLTGVTIPNSVTTIGNYTFFDCKGLTSIVIPNSVQTIGNYAFSGCSGMTSITIPNSVQTIRSAAFWGCSGLTSVCIPNSVQTIGNYAFFGCTGLTLITIPNSVTTIGEWAFSDCTGLTSVIIPPTVTSVDNSAFYNCTGLIKSAYPDNLVYCPFSNGIKIKYPKDAFFDEKGVIYSSAKDFIYFAPLSLEGEYSIPNSVTSIGYDAFYGCTSLTYVKVSWTKPISIDANVFGSDTYSKATLDIPENSLITYLEAANWNKFSNISVADNPTKLFSDSVLKYRLIENPDNREAVVVNGNYSSMTEVNIPEHFTDDSDAANPVRYIITAIAPDAFKDCTKLKTVNFHSRSVIKEIGANAFSGCTALTGIKLPETVTSIGNSAFFRCTNLTSVAIPNFVTFIGESAFFECSGLTSVVIPNSVTSIGESAFFECNGLTSVIIGNSVQTIGNIAFYKCTGLTSVAIPNSVRTIGDRAFGCCTSLERFIVDDDNPNFTVINGVLFNKNKTELLIYPYGITGPYAIPNSVRTIGVGAFWNCNGLSSVVIPNSVTTIGEWAFSYCYRLTSVFIPDSVQTIGNSAFYGCSYLTSITINNSVRTIGDEAFSGCTGLTEVYYNSENPIEGNADIFSNDSYSKATLFMPENSIDKAKQIDPWKNFTNIKINEDWSYLYDGIYYTVIDEDAKTCKTKSGYKSGYNRVPGNNVSGDIILPEIVKINGENYTLVEIGDSSFYNNSKLTSISIPNSVQTIGDRAFTFCSGLTSITIPNSVRTIGNAAFSDCSSLTSVTIGNSVQTIGNYAFSDCKSLTSVVIPNSVTTIGEWAFSDCYRLTSVVIPNSVKTIGNRAFYDCYGLTSISIGNSVQTIGELAFFCTDLTSVVLPNSVKTIGNRAFALCNSLKNFIVEENNPNFTVTDGVLFNKNRTEILIFPSGKTGAYTIPNLVTSIGNYAFAQCLGLTSVVIPNSVQTIGEFAFFGSGLTSVVIPNSVKTISNYAFQRCSKLTSVIIPNSITTIGNYAFSSCSGLTSVYYNSENPIKGDTGIFSDESYSNAILYLPENGVNKAKQINPWKNFEKIEAYDFGGVNDIMVDKSDEINYSEPYEIYNFNGVKVGDNKESIAPGLYIIRQGPTTKKIVIQ